MKNILSGLIILFSLLVLPVPALAGDQTLVLAVPSEPGGFDPAATMDNNDWRQIYPCYDRLVRYKPFAPGETVQVVPGAAESWEVSDDGLVWTFRIRQGIFFSDNTPLDANAVKFSLERVRRMNKGPAGIFSHVSRIEAAAPYVLAVTLDAPFAPFLQTLAVNAASIVNPRVMEWEIEGDLAGGRLSAATDGSGPYELEEWVRGKHCVLRAKPGYWGGAPSIKRVRIEFIPDDRKRLAALNQGRADLAEGLPREMIPELEADPEVRVYENPSQLVQYVYLNNQRPGLDNILVRQALSHAVDVRAVIERVMAGDAIQMCGPIPKGMAGWSQTPCRFDFDPAKAKELLAQAKAGTGLEFELIYSGRSADWDGIAAMLRDDFKRIGVGLKLKKMANTELRDRIDKAEFDLCLGVWSPDFADPFMFMNLWFDSANQGLAGNRAFYSNPRADALLARAVREWDFSARMALYREVRDIVTPEAPYILLFQANSIVTARKRVKGYVYNPMLESMYDFSSMSLDGED